MFAKTLNTLETVTGGVLWKKLILKFPKFQRKTPVFAFLFIKVAVLDACNFIKKKIQQRCFRLKFAKFLRTRILKNIRERLLPSNTHLKLL